MTSGRLQEDFRKTSGRLQVLGLSHVSLMSFEALSLSFVCKSEPKILRLVFSKFCYRHLIFRDKTFQYQKKNFEEYNFRKHERSPLGNQIRNGTMKRFQSDSWRGKYLIHIIPPPAASRPSLVARVWKVGVE